MPGRAPGPHRGNVATQQSLTVASLRGSPSARMLPRAIGHCVLCASCGSGFRCPCVQAGRCCASAHAVLDAVHESLLPSKTRLVTGRAAQASGCMSDWTGYMGNRRARTWFTSGLRMGPGTTLCRGRDSACDSKSWISGVHAQQAIASAELCGCSRDQRPMTVGFQGLRGIVFGSLPSVGGAG